MNNEIEDKYKVVAQKYRDGELEEIIWFEKLKYELKDMKRVLEMKGYKTNIQLVTKEQK